jgi:Prealbumin-like fold domain
MTERVLGPTGGRRRKRLAIFVPFFVLAALILAIGASAGPIGALSGFQDDDGNLADEGAGIDWNNFASTTWTGTSPYLTSSKTASGWAFTGLADAEAVTSDSNFNGGVKQDDDCAATGTGKSSNKDDLKRIYVASQTINGHTYLNLAWVRITQNTTSPSAHVGFEFNQNDGSGTTGCGSGSPLVKRSTANGGDMLIVYDFEGGSGDAPHITMRRWVGSGSCEVSSDSPPCWGTAVDLTNNSTAEAKVNVSSTALDSIGPSSQTLGLSEFGEAGIDLTNAGVFTSGTCTGFGRVYGVSRSSGNSGTAQMKDLVGPGSISLRNCGTVTIIKHTSPSGLNQNFGYTSTLAGGQISCSTDTTPASFTLNAGGTDTETCTNVPIGNYTVTEGADPSGFAFGSLSCTHTGSGTGAQDGTVPKQANIGIVAGSDTVTCTYVNNQQLGAIQVSKTSKKTGNALSGAKFSVTGPNSFSTTITTGSDGKACVDNLAFGSYTVTETQAPTGFVIDTTAGQSVTVDNNAKCSDNPFGGETKSFTDTPTSTIQVNFKDDGSGETNGSGTTIVCDPANGNGTDSTTAATGWQKSLTRTGIKTGTSDTVINCTITIDP